MTSAPVRGPLAGTVVDLEPIEAAHAPELFAALDHPQVWAAGYGGGRAPASVAETEHLIATYLTGGSGGGVAWAVRLRGSGRLVGTSTLGDIDLPNESAHLGWTAYTPSVWGTAVNADTKLTILTHAFDDCGFGRVKLQVDDRNARSQAAVARLGAVREGMLRRDRRRADGSWRDTVVYSILREEWSAVRAGLVARIADAAEPR